MTATAADWIKRRRELLASATDGPWADIASPKDARTSLPLALDALDAVLTQHRPVSYAATANCGLVLYEVCPTCHDKAGVHPCGCWRDEDQIHVCADCRRVWPCLTVEAIDTALRGES